MAAYADPDEDAVMQEGYHEVSKTRRSPQVVIDDNHPFELETYIQSYQDRGAISRLQYIAHAAPSLAIPALQRALEIAKTGRDTQLYQNLTQSLLSIVGQDASLSIDQKWLDATTAKNTAQKDKLETELKMYTGSMIKESVRLGHNELGHFHRSIGDTATALRHYTKSREFCTTTQHVVDMCLYILELMLEQQNYAHISTYAFKAEAALESVQADKKKSGAPSPEKAGVQSKLDLAMALAMLGQSNYERAAWSFLKIEKNVDDWLGKIVAPGDIAVYGTLCALATFERSQIQRSVVERESFSYFLEQEPYIRDILEAYMASKFKTVLSLLDRYSTKHLLDIHLSSHVKDLMDRIRNKALVLYFKPFASIKLDSLASAFGLSLEETERNVVALIQDGSIKGRVDSHNKILKAKDLDHRTELFTRAIKAGGDIEVTNRKLLLRLRLLQADLIIKPPRQENAPYE